MAERQRVGVVGVGAMGAHHARVYEELPEAELVAVADRDESRLAAIEASHHVRGYESYANMLAEEELDALSVVVPTRLHEEVGLVCIERGIAVLVEKPLAVDVSQAERLRAAAASFDVPLQVGHIERFNPGVVELKARLDARTAGDILQVNAQRVGPFFPRERDIGVVHDLATHDVDIFRHLIGSDIETVRAETQSGIKTPYEDALSAVVRFANGTVGTLDVNWLSPVKTRELRVLCERGAYRLDYITQALSFHETSTLVPDASSEGTSIDVQTQEPLRAELQAFLRAAKQEEQPSVGADDAMATMRVVDALIESAKLGEPQTVKAS